MKKSIFHTVVICLILLLNTAPLYPNSESRMLYQNYLNETDDSVERERKNMVKGMMLPLVIWNSISIGYERRLTYHSAIHLNASFFAVIIGSEDGGAFIRSDMIINTEYRYYLRTTQSSFFYNFYPLVFFWPIMIGKEYNKDNYPIGFRPGIGVGKLFKISKNIGLDLNIGVGHFSEWNDNSVSHQFVFPKIGLMFAFKF